jgi:U6 snRNA-associated Sm-like protein LSm8
MSLLPEYVDKSVSIITNDGRVIVGKLRGFDQYINCVLEQSVERVYTQDGAQTVPLGLYIVRGENIAVVGLIDEEIDESIDLAQVKANPLPPLIV